jgi:hypothetical protein
MLGEKSTLNTRTRRLRPNIPVDPMDDAPVDNVNAQFVDNNGPIGHDFTEEIYVVRNDVNTSNVDEKPMPKSILKNGPKKVIRPLPIVELQSVTTKAVQPEIPFDFNKLMSAIKDISDETFDLEVARNCASPDWDETDNSFTSKFDSDSDSDSDSEGYRPSSALMNHMYYFTPTSSEQPPRNDENELESATSPKDSNAVSHDEVLLETNNSQLSEVESIDSDSYEDFDLTSLEFFSPFGFEPPE